MRRKSVYPSGAPSHRTQSAVIGLMGLLWLAAVPGQAWAQPVDPLAASRGAMERGDQLWAQGYVGAACATYDEAHMLAPEWWYPVPRRLQCGRTVPGAARQLTEASERLGEPYAITLLLGRYYTSVGEHGKALVLLQTALNLDPNSLPLMLEVANALVESGRAPANVAFLLNLWEAHRIGLFGVAAFRAMEGQGDLPAAERQLRTLCTNSSNPLRAWLELAAFYERHGCSKQAAAMGRKLGQDRFRPASDLLPENCFEPRERPGR